MNYFNSYLFIRCWIIHALFILSLLPLWGQDIALNTWRTHFSYKEARKIEMTPNKIFCATQNGLFSREFETGVITRLSKIDGLSSVGVSAMKYDPINEILVVGYHSGFVDFIYSNQILSISQIANTNLNKDKNIYAIAFSSSHTFLATDFGVIRVKTNDATVVENFVQIGDGGNAVEVVEILATNDSLIIKTNEGIQSGNLLNNLLDFNNWNQYSETLEFTNLTKSADKIYALNSSNLMSLVDGNWEDTGITLPEGANKLFQVNENIFSASNGVIYRLTTEEFIEISQVEAAHINDLNFIGTTLILADSLLGLIDKNKNELFPSGPLSDDFSNVRVIEGKTFGFHSPNPLNYDGTEKQSLFSVFAEGNWELREIDEFINVSDVALFNGNYYFSSIGKGIYDESNEQIQLPGISSQADTVITTLVAGGDDLWASSFGSNNPIHILDRQGSWKSLSTTQLFDSSYLTINLSETGVAWLRDVSGKITILNEAQNSVERIERLSGLPVGFTDIEISVEDNAWIATTRGPALFSAASLLPSSQEIIRPLYENLLLFREEQIHTILTDGGNNVWFGTEKGIWVYDEDITELLTIFNEENSPLPSNRIMKMEYNSINGEIFILTDKGMVSYRSASSVGSISNQKVTIFPNPVLPSYQGLVGIAGLANNANIKITDVNGNLVQEIDAVGGTSSWNLRDINNAQVATGIYLFFSYSAEGEEAYCGKIAVVR